MRYLPAPLQRLSLLCGKLDLHPFCYIAGKHSERDRSSRRVADEKNQPQRQLFAVFAVKYAVEFRRIDPCRRFPGTALHFEVVYLVGGSGGRLVDRIPDPLDAVYEIRCEKQQYTRPSEGK